MIKMVGEIANLHAVDLSRKDVQAVRRELMEQLSTIGFLVLTNIPGYDEAGYLKACKALHALPDDEKRKMYLKQDNPNNPNVYRGYQPFKANDASHKEFLDMGCPVEMLSEYERAMPLYEATPMAGGEEHRWMWEKIEETRRAWYATGIYVTRLLAEGLGKPSSFFDSWFVDGSLSTMRSIHYLPRSAGVVDSGLLNEDDAKLTTPGHTDSGFLTFLATFGYPGLQVQMDGEYRSVAPVTNTLVVNVGETFARLTGHRLKATFHRVLDIGVERYSSPLFLEPKYSARIPTGLLESSRQAAEEDLLETDVMFGDWLMRRMMASYVEWEAFEIPAERRAQVEAISLDDVGLVANSKSAKLTQPKSRL